MSLTHKHFNELAEIFRSFEPDEKEQEGFDGFTSTNEFLLWKQLRQRIAEFCAKHNSQFDYERFMKASESHD